MRQPDIAMSRATRSRGNVSQFSRVHGLGAGGRPTPSQGLSERMPCAGSSRCMPRMSARRRTGRWWSIGLLIETGGLR
jgi:hypothetical protein